MSQPASGPLQFAVVCEADGDLRTATELADRQLCDSFDWLADYLEASRTWISVARDGGPLVWRRVRELARGAGLTGFAVAGHFGGEPGEEDAATARKAILYLLDAYPGLDAILLIRDQDDEPGRRNGLEQARREDPDRLIVIGFAVVGREAWVLAGFDPVERSHELTACKDDQAKRSPKRVLRHVTGGDPDRERRCWADAPLDRLRQRGGDNGLAAYLGEVRDRLSRLVGRVG